MKQIFILFFSAGLLAACAEDGSLGREGSVHWFNTKSPQEIAAYYEGVCRTYGFTSGTDAMAGCIASEVQNARAGNSVRSVNTLNAYNSTSSAVAGQ